MKNINIWYLSSFFISLLVAIPILTVFSSFFENTSNYFEILKNTFLLEYIFNSFVLLIGVLCLTFIIGVGCAYLVSFYNFPLVSFFKWALILSFAVPPYIYAYSLTAFFENYGTAFTILKNLFGDGDYNKSIPKFDGMLGAILSVSFSLFGYVYILTRASFYYQSQNLIELGKNLGFSKIKSMFSIILPSARPAIVAGLSLVAMETLSDFGAVSFFGINTLTTGIYNSWIAFDDLAFANQLSFYLLIFILALFILENYSRKKAKYHSPTKGGFKQKEKTNLYNLKSFMAFLACAIVLFISFIFPLTQMLYWTIIFPKNFTDLNIQQLLINTIYLVVLSSSVLIIFSFISNYGNRVSRSKFLNLLTTFSVSGYAIPGVILAVAFISFIAWFDNNVISFFEIKSIKKIFIGSILGLVLVYFVRFYSLACNGIRSGYEKINRSIDESAYLIGYSKLKTFLNIHVPYLKNSALLITILISLEVIRELPITLILRPFNFETFATTAYIYASQDLLEAAAVPSLFLILIASFFILTTSKYILREDNE
ncbi:MAG TPA: iron ABC transporter permease [Candidatus Pelagibacter bacterium]|jgi:iron(III) transport system permease protein|nr:iron ABC transporter [Pelagibacteraceae bacterium]HJN84207.1 iron ABC transporter permease [Candidatus Pelagibacter bacterium]|tara:strand:+ start:308 stop:1930 length:1623 start_codon:yes stop_codon:yes gene_type:complete